MSDEMAPRPIWLDDEPVIRDWLHEALKRLEGLPAEARKLPLRFSVNARRFPALFRQGPAADATWELIKTLKERLPLRVVPLPRRDAFAPEYEGARLELDPACEATLRGWLGRPRVTVYESDWRAAVEPTRPLWSDAAFAQLLITPLRVEGRSAEEVVTALVALGRWHGVGLSWRELSARAFFGDSKFIENRCAALVQALYPQLTPRVRPLLVSVALPGTIRGVLLVENHDTYLRLADNGCAASAELAVVYAAGFLGSAARIRQRDGAVIHYRRENGARERFEQWWFEEQRRSWPVWFFGDLDFEGMRILAALHQGFGATAWQPGYAPLLHALNAGFGHLPAAADKENQRAPRATGCPYADGVLLPALAARQAFVDQELWFGNEPS